MHIKSYIIIRNTIFLKPLLPTRLSDLNVKWLRLQSEGQSLRQRITHCAEQENLLGIGSSRVKMQAYHLLLLQQLLCKRAGDDGIRIGMNIWKRKCMSKGLDCIRIFLFSDL
jgi:hypothetical protein